MLYFCHNTKRKTNQIIKHHHTQSHWNIANCFKNQQINQTFKTIISLKLVSVK